MARALGSVCERGPAASGVVLEARRSRTSALRSAHCPAPWLRRRRERKRAPAGSRARGSRSETS
eukprot:6182934-Lingulodinium_polyedra.AAC.1